MSAALPGGAIGVDEARARLRPVEFPVPRLRLPGRLEPFVLISPAIAFLLLFVVVPAVLAFAIALFHWSPLSGRSTFVGLDNYTRVLTSPTLLNALGNTLLYAVMTVPTSVAGGLLVAVGINALSRGRVFWRAVYFLPMAAVLVAMAAAWRWIFYPESGLFDQTLGAVLGRTGWLSSADLSLLGLAIVGNWHNIGYVAVIFLAGLTGVRRDLHEAAVLDGAGAWQRFWHVTWPAISPATVFAIVISTTSALRMFETAQVMTRGGPGESTSTLAYLLWQQGIRNVDFGSAAVTTVVLFLLCLLVTAWQMRSFGTRLEKAGSR
ncbi:carbohydrate ABC transporter permease [Saccharopolyspora hattusasensis]|uniref:carbohydrate ABC transporter permease n=1 Tax=Saccharopolyspora hattusasensis TaxID=1128679 RepID=UPI003D98D35F